MPGSNTSDFSITSVGFLLQVSHTPSLYNSSKSLSLGHINHVHNLILTEDLIDSDFLLEESVGEVDLITDSFAPVDLDLEDIVFLLSDVGKQVVLGMGNSSDHCTVLSDSVELDFNSLGVFRRL